MLAIAKKSLRNSPMKCWPSAILLFVGLHVSLIFEPHILLCHCCDVVLLVVVLLLFVKVDQIMVQWLIEHFDILQTSLDIAVFPWTNLVKCWSSPAHAWFCCFETSSARSAWRLSAGRKSRTCSSHFRICDVTSVTKCSRWSSRAWFASWENRENSSLCLCENRASALVRAVELKSAHYNCAPHYFLPKHWQDVASQTLRVDEWQRQINSLCWWTNARRAVSLWSFRASRARCVTTWTVSWRPMTAREPEGTYWILWLPRIHPVWLGIGWRLGTFHKRPPSACENVTLLMQNCKMKHLHSREAVTKCRTDEHSRLPRHVINSPLEQPFRPYQSHCWDHNLCLLVECSIR